MRLLIVIILCLTTSLNGQLGTSAGHTEERCHIFEGDHHDEATADHVDDHNHDAEHADHKEGDNCEPEHCSDHCYICHVIPSGFVTLSENRANQIAPILKEIIATDLKIPTAIATRPDTPPPKA